MLSLAILLQAAGVVLTFTLGVFGYVIGPALVIAGGSILARTLKPLKPSEEELEAALAELTKLRHKIGRKLSSRDLMTALA